MGEEKNMIVPPHSQDSGFSFPIFGVQRETTLLVPVKAVYSDKKN